MDWIGRELDLELHGGAFEDFLIEMLHNYLLQNGDERQNCLPRE